MSYNRQTWFNHPDGDTPISATRLNHIEDGIDDVSNELDALSQEVDDLTSSTTANLADESSARTAGDLDLAEDIEQLTLALDDKAPLESPEFTGTVTGITKAMVGLGSVDNTPDAAKPVSIAQAAAIAAKATNTAVVHLTGDETIAGVKTFSSPPVVPDESFTVEKIDATGVPSDSTYLRGDGTWSLIDEDTAALVEGASDATNADVEVSGSYTTYAAATEANPSRRMLAFATFSGHIARGTGSGPGYLRGRVDLTFDGGSTWHQGKEVWQVTESELHLHSISVSFVYAATATGDIIARFVAKREGDPQVKLNGQIDMFIIPA